MLKSQIVDSTMIVRPEGFTYSARAEPDGVFVVVNAYEGEKSFFGVGLGILRCSPQIVRIRPLMVRIRAPIVQDPQLQEPQLNKSDS